MRIGSRLSFITISLVLITLGIYALVMLRTQRREVSAEIERQMVPTGSAVKVALEAAIRDGLYRDVSLLVRRWQEADPKTGYTYIDFAHSQPGKTPPGFTYGAADPKLAPTPAASAADMGDTDDENYVAVPAPADANRESRLARVAVSNEPVGESVNRDGISTFVYAVPIYDANDTLIGVIELSRDTSLYDAERDSAGKKLFVIVAGLGAMLALFVWLLAKTTISSPLKRLLEAIDDVTQGDYGRVILRERDDEVGDLADRFNRMTSSLRDAQSEIIEGVDAKLNLEARLRHTEKLATIGQLAAGIAHEVGTPLNVIGGRARAMEKKAMSDATLIDASDIAKNANIIAEQTQRITKIIQQLLDFARRPTSSRSQVDIVKVAHDCLDFLSHQSDSSNVVVTELPFAAQSADAPQTPIAAGDADQLQQVFLNLFVNAMQAMASGGRLQVSVQSLIRRRPGLDVSAPGKYIVVDVADTGPGIPEPDRERIFEPFYSTKHEGGGTGLGLAVSVGIVKDHDGWMEIDDRAGGGTIFRVFLPAYDATTESSKLRALDKS
jgi:signal transduction histidine kinase